MEIPAGSSGLAKSGFAVCHQVTTLDRTKLTKRIGMLDAEVLHDVEMAIKAAMDLT